VVSGEVLADSSKALFGTELCGLLASLEAASPGCGKVCIDEQAIHSCVLIIYSLLFILLKSE
jgi:hypothetical protein